ncbi:MAG: three-Cys-motif partner protein TcmP [Pseudomonadota bacterium]|uniref:three-Cys-motif partner protein TcmP n=1 Tax=Phenylobacterium sp. TaxID=1871053 RepID=UPI0025FC536E|nr:three-Cys-motif partner protein TcmP [Phenylobacterium sp.]MBT9472067.1 three-Cys-motif partner protein TcmP [Phenylobacterium sp.]
MIGELKDYAGREQAYVKHFLLSEYLESWAHKVSSSWNDVAYVDGFSGPWQASGEQFHDTSFGIALSALTRAKASWRNLGRTVRMSAYLVEKDPEAYGKLQAAKALFPDVEIKTYPGSFIDQASTIRGDIPPQAFAFLFIDPKGWAIDMKLLAPLLKRPNSEVVFNFMFDFINRAASIQSPGIGASLDSLFDGTAWRDRLTGTTVPGANEAEFRKNMLVDSFASALGRLGQYPYVAETTVLRPLKDRALYCLVYGTRKPQGLEGFRAAQIKALRKQDHARGLAKMSRLSETNEQTEMFSSFSEMMQDPSIAFLAGEERHARDLVRELTPQAPESMTWGDIWPKVLQRRVVTKTQVKKIARDLRTSGEIAFLGWAPKQISPEDQNLVCRL